MIGERMRNLQLLLTTLIALSLFSPAKSSPAAETPIREGETVRVGSAAYRIARLDDLPYVQSEYTRRYAFDSYDNAKLKELRERYRLDEVVAAGKDEFEKQLLLLDWVNHRF